MLLKSRTPRIEKCTAEATEGFHHLDPSALSVLRWLKVNRIEFVLVGAVAAAIRGQASEAGPVAIAPAPYRRNLERLAHALERSRASLRLDETTGVNGGADTAPAKLTAEHLAAPQVWMLRCGSHALDIEGQIRGSAGYQELLYEASGFEPAAGLRVEVASPEDIERHAHIRRTGSEPEIRIIRNVPA